MRDFGAAATRIHYFNGRERRRSSGVGPSQVHHFSAEEFNTSGHEPLEVESATLHTSTNLSQSVGNVMSNPSGIRDGSVNPRYSFSAQLIELLFCQKKICHVIT